MEFTKNAIKQIILKKYFWSYLTTLPWLESNTFLFCSDCWFFGGGGFFFSFSFSVFFFFGGGGCFLGFFFLFMVIHWLYPYNSTVLIVTACSMFLSLSVCLSVCIVTACSMFLSLSVCLSVCLSVSLSLSLSLSLFLLLLLFFFFFFCNIFILFFVTNNHLPDFSHI